jgi:1-deoxy-D-xylulose-5-phosphate reductoisomerase
MTFEALDTRGHPERFPGLQLAWDALRAPAGTTAVLNAANEVAVAAFLARQIRFDQIHAVNVETLTGVRIARPASLSDLLSLDAQARAVAAEVVRRLGA